VRPSFCHLVVTTSYKSPSSRNLARVSHLAQIYFILAIRQRNTSTIQASELSKLNIPVTEHDKLPDIILYWIERNWLFLIEAVTLHGPVSPKRYREIETMLKGCSAERVYVTAFPDAKMFRR
jgi:hypothetical protein